MKEIFISYTRCNKNVAKSFAVQFERRGWSVFLDFEIDFGTFFPTVIEEALKSAKCVVVLWSRESIDSNWVIEEADEGKRCGTLIPVLIDDIKGNEIPLGFRRIQTARLINWDGKESHPEFQRLLESISKLIDDSKFNKQNYEVVLRPRVKQLIQNTQTEKSKLERKKNPGCTDDEIFAGIFGMYAYTKNGKILFDKLSLFFILNKLRDFEMHAAFLRFVYGKSKDEGLLKKAHKIDDFILKIWFIEFDHRKSNGLG